jgi:hypothetical protein
MAAARGSEFVFVAAQAPSTMPTDAASIKLFGGAHFENACGATIAASVIVRTSSRASGVTEATAVVHTQLVRKSEL